MGMNLYQQYVNLKQQEGAIKMMENPKNNLVTVSYIHSGVDFSNPLYRRARGLTMTKEGDIVLRGFEKFFNYKELETYDTYTDEFKQEYSLIENGVNKKVTVQEKLDGTMVLLGVYQGEFIVSTTSSTNNNYADKILTYVNNTDTFKPIKEYLMSLPIPHTLIFEYIGPFNQIVVFYEEMDMVLLGQVNNHTGRVTGVHETQHIAKKLNVTSPELYEYTIDELVYLQQTLDGVEGFVAINDDNRRIKFKTHYWFDQSKNRTIFFNDRLTRNTVDTVLDWYFDDEIDDYIAYQNQHQVYRKYDMIGRVLSPIKDLWKQAHIYKGYYEDLMNKTDKKTAVKWLHDELEDHSQLRTLVHSLMKRTQDETQRDLYHMVGDFYHRYILEYYGLNEQPQLELNLKNHAIRQLTKQLTVINESKREEDKHR